MSGVDLLVSTTRGRLVPQTSAVIVAQSSGDGDVVMVGEDIDAAADPSMSLASWYQGIVDESAAQTPKCIGELDKKAALNKVQIMVFSAAKKWQAEVEKNAGKVTIEIKTSSALDPDSQPKMTENFKSKATLKQDSMGKIEIPFWGGGHRCDQPASRWEGQHALLGRYR